MLSDSILDDCETTAYCDFGVAKTFKIYKRNTIDIFDGILQKALKFLEYLEEQFELLL